MQSFYLLCSRIVVTLVPSAELSRLPVSARQVF